MPVPVRWCCAERCSTLQVDTAVHVCLPHVPAEGDQADGSRKAASDLYGAEHLVRLFVKLPELVPVAFMTPPVRQAVCRGLLGLLRGLLRLHAAAAASTRRGMLVALERACGKQLNLSPLHSPLHSPSPAHRTWCDWNSSCTT